MRRKRPTTRRFAKQLAGLADVYVDDAFGAAHRAHASTEGITHFVKEKAAGLLMEKELKFLGKALQSPDKPFVAIVGGAKVADKIAVIDNLLDKVDAIIVGGGMAYTFLNAQGQKTGKSLLEADKIDVAAAALKKAERRRACGSCCRWTMCWRTGLPTTRRTQVFDGTGDFPAEMMALDIGPKSIELFVKEIAAASTIVWNGPMGVFEMPSVCRGHDGGGGGGCRERGRDEHHRRRRLRECGCAWPGLRTGSRTFPRAAERRWSF